MSSTSDKILDVAEYRMRRGGYNAVSFRDLASDVQIKSASVHYHFPQKHDLGLALMDRYSNRMFDLLERRASAATSPIEKLRAFVSVHRSCLVEDQAVCLGGLLGAEKAGLPNVLQDRIKRFFEDNVTWVENVLPSTISSKERRQRAGSLVAALQGSILVSHGLGDNSIFDGMTESLINYTLAE